MTARSVRPTVRGLARWAAGSESDTAAVQLLASAFGGRLCDRGWPWVRPCRRAGWWYLDGGALAAASDVSTVLAVAGWLVDGSPLDDPDRLLWLGRREATAVDQALAVAGRPLPVTTSGRAA